MTNLFASIPLFSEPKPDNHQFFNSGFGEPFDLMFADPAWPFDIWNSETCDQTRLMTNKYSIMTVEDIISLPVKDIMAKNSVLLMWATWPNIEAAFEVIKGWGFSYRSHAWDWIKLTKGGKMWHMGGGFYTRANPEPCLLAVRGNMPVAVRDELELITEWIEDEPIITSDALISPVQEHSRKPELGYFKLDRLYPLSRYPNRIELFASKHSVYYARKYGFKAALGYDVDGRDIRDGLRDIADSIRLGERARRTGGIDNPAENSG